MNKAISFADSMSFDFIYGLGRNYYQDRETGEYVFLLDQYLNFDGTKGMSPVVQELAIELAVTGVSYRQAGQALEKLLGYPVISHEGIRQQLLNTEVIPEEAIVPLQQDVLFVEVDGLYTIRHRTPRTGRWRIVGLLCGYLEEKTWHEGKGESFPKPCKLGKQQVTWPPFFKKDNCKIDSHCVKVKKIGKVY